MDTVSPLAFFRLKSWLFCFWDEIAPAVVTSADPLVVLLEVERQHQHPGFKLAWGIARELEADGLYSFQKEEEQRACEIMEREVNGDG